MEEQLVEPTVQIVRDSMTAHCYDSYYKVYGEQEDEYFVDDNPLSTSKAPEIDKTEFSGTLGVRMKHARSEDIDIDDNLMANFVGKTNLYVMNRRKFRRRSFCLPYSVLFDRYYIEAEAFRKPEKFLFN